MKKNRLLACISAIALLYGCGGGGGGVTPSVNQLSGIAAKGLLSKADVQAYEVVGGKLVKLGAATKTGEDGSYLLTGLPNTSNPVVVEVTTNAETDMLDETLPLTGGKFQKSTVRPAPNTKLRTTVNELKGNVEVQINPFTEMAVAAAASTTGGLTASSIAAGKDAVIQTLGLNPFVVKAVNAGDSMNPEQQKLMMLLTGVMKQASDAKGATGCSDPTGVACAVAALNAKAAMSTDTDGKFVMTQAVALRDEIKSTMTKAATVNTSFTTGLSSVAASYEPAAPVAVDPTAALYRQGLDGFLEGLRSGFRTAQASIRERSELADKRLEKLVIDGSKQALNELGDALEACSANSAGLLVCEGSGFIPSGNGYTTSKTSGEFTATATISGTGVNGVLNLAMTGSAKRNKDNKPVASFSVTLAGSGLTDGSKAASFTISTGTMRGYDSASDFAKWAQLDVTGMTLTMAKPDSLETLTLRGPLKLSSSDGDNFSGTINSLVVQQLVTNVYYPGDTDLYVKSFDLSLGVNANEGKILSTGLKYNRDLVGYNPERPSTASNPKKESVDLTLAFADNVTAAVTGSKTVYDKTGYSATIKSDGSTISLAFSTARANTAVDHESLAGDLVLTGSGDYRAVLTTDSKGNVSGEVFKGTTKIGTVSNGILTVDGRIMSIS